MNAKTSKVNGGAGKPASAAEEHVRPIRVLLAEDQPDLLASARNLIGRLARLELAGVAESGTEAIRQVAALAPDLVLMDATLPQKNGFDAAQEIKAQPHPPRIIMLTLFNGPGYEFTAKAAGADGLISKSELGTRLPQKLRTLFPAATAA